jgi:hypothetical protein
MAGGQMYDLLSVRLIRERQIAQEILDTPLPALQPGLFDRRAERMHLADSSAIREAANEIAARLRLLEQGGVVSPRPARLLLVLVP